MPSIQNLVPDLAAGTINGLRGRPASHHENRYSVVSGTCRVAYSSVNMMASISAGDFLACASAVASREFNGNYLHFQDDLTTCAKLDIHRPIVVSGGFSGCAYKVFKTPDGFVCTHIARSGGSDALVTLLESYAGQSDWTELQSLSTAGMIGQNGCTEVCIVSQLRGDSIHTILLKLSQTGNLISADNYTITATR